MTNPTHRNGSCFPSQLFALLEQAEDDGMASIVSWQPHGRAFKIHRKDQFVQHVLPRWFRHTNYNSFQRQLNIYGFRRFPEGRDKDAYYHQRFVRGEYQQTLTIPRHAIKGTGVRQPIDNTPHPDFYEQQGGRMDNPSGPTTAHNRTTSISHLQREQSASQPPIAPSIPQHHVAPSIPQHDAILPSSTLYDTHIQNYLRINHRSRDSAHTASTAILPNVHRYTQYSLIPNSELTGILQLSSTALNASILARTGLLPWSQTDLMPLHPSRFSNTIVEEMIQARAMLTALHQQQRRNENPVAMPLTSESMNNSYSNVPPALLQDDILDLLVRHGLYRNSPRGSGL